MRKFIKGTLWTVLIVFVIMNILAAIHAYKFTHFSASGVRNEQLKLTPLTSLKLLFTGVDNPRPYNTDTPKTQYERIMVQSNVMLECWYLHATGTPKGTIVIFHGYTGNKTKLLPRAAPLVAAGYNCVLVDFMGSGGSGGNSTTVGYTEAEEVRDCFNYLKQHGEKNLCLLGSSMGAVAIMRAISDYHINPMAVILECPFATMYETTVIRFKSMHMPVFPMAALLVFWGGVENGFWGFGHNPVVYAKKVNCPVLLQYGAHDDRVARDETDRIFRNLPSARLVVYPNAGHDNYVATSPAEWTKNITGFLEALKGENIYPAKP